MAEGKITLYVPKEEEGREVSFWPWRERVEFLDKETGELLYRDLEGYITEKIWDIGDKDPLLAHVLEAIYIEVRAVKERLKELEEEIEERDGCER